MTSRRPLVRIGGRNALLPAGDTLEGAGLSSLGVGQTWVDVTSTRALATTYTNSTGKPIQVSIFGGPASANNVGYILTVDGTAIRFTYTTSGLFTSAANVIIPPGSTYRVVATNGNLPLYGWWELR